MLTTGVLTGALLGGGLAASVWRGTAYAPPTATELLARSQRFVGRARTVRFTGSARVEETADENASDPSRGNTFVHRATLTGEARLSDRGHVTVVAGSDYTETISVGDTIFERSSDSQSGLANEKWAEFNPRPGEAQKGIVRPGSGSAAQDPTDPSRPNLLPRVIRAAHHPRLVRTRGTVRVVRAEVDVRRAFGEAAAEVGTSHVELTVAEDGRLVRVRLLFNVYSEGSAATVSIDYQLTGWGGPVRIEAPPESQLDRTPGVDEEKIVAFTSAPLLQPHGIPAGWEPDGATVIPASETEEGCDQVELDYTDPRSEDTGYLTLYELPSSCADLTAPGGSQPFQAGDAGGWVEVDQDGFLTAQLTFGRTVVQVDTDLQPAEVGTVLAQMRPLDLKVAPVAIPGIGGSRSSA